MRTALTLDTLPHLYTHVSISGLYKYRKTHLRHTEKQKHAKINLLKHKHSVILLQLRREIVPHSQMDRCQGKNLCTQLYKHRPHCPGIIVFFSKRTFLVLYVLFTLRQLCFIRCFFFTLSGSVLEKLHRKPTDDCLHAFLIYTRISRETTSQSKDYI